MSEITNIRRKAAKFYEATGKNPTRVYLAGGAWHGLTQELKTLGFCVSPLHQPDQSCRFEGMRITLTLGDDRHIGFSYDEEDVA